MFMPQTLEEYLDNPMGKGSTAIANRNLIKTDLNTRYEKLINTHKSFKHYHYHDKHNFYIHIIIPSESKRNNTYDVVIQFAPTEKEVIKDINLKRYTIKVFSNCPSFTYTYAYVYNNYDLMIDFLKDKYNDMILSDNPIIKNPGEVINFEKSVYFACKYIKSNGTFLNKVALASFSKPLDTKKFKDSIRSTDTIDLEIKKENNRIKEENEKNKYDRKHALDNALESRPKKIINKITGTTKKRNDHRIVPHAKIRGKSKVKSTIKK